MTSLVTCLVAGKAEMRTSSLAALVTARRVEEGARGKGVTGGGTGEASQAKGVAFLETLFLRIDTGSGEKASNYCVCVRE